MKEILCAISGEFRGCELTAIVGPSGSGKSTMLNILSGYSPQFTGTIKVNDSIAHQKTIRWKSSYIMQENKLHGFLTVYETMSFAMNLKVGRRLNADQRRFKVSASSHCSSLIYEDLHFRFMKFSSRWDLWKR